MGKLEELLLLVEELNFTYVVATASREYPDVKASDILEDLHSSENPYRRAQEKYDLPILYDKNGRVPIPLEKDSLMAASGDFYLLCPFHADQTLGSCLLTVKPGIKMLKCFSCGAGSNIFSFERKFYGFSNDAKGFVQSIYHLCYRMGLIEQSEYRFGKFTKINEEAINLMKEQYEKKDLLVQERADADVMHSVYSAMLKCCPLSKKHKKHLLWERRIAPEDLGDFFTFPTKRTRLVKKIASILIEEFSHHYYGKPFCDLTKEERAKLQMKKGCQKIDSQFARVPGFYVNKTIQSIEYSSYGGIGIAVRDDRGKIVGIQVRTEDPKRRYVWFSSSFVLGDPHYEGGSSPSAPGGVIFPKEREEEANICITEGRFKAEAIAETGDIAVYVSGVSSWQKVIPMLERLIGQRKKIYMMFDADMMGNTAVYDQLSKASKAIKEKGVEVYLKCWRLDLGKGFDDFYHRQGSLAYRRHMKVISFQEFSEIYTFSCEELLKEYDCSSVRDIAEEKKKDFKKDLQRSIESILFVH